MLLFLGAAVGLYVFLVEPLWVLPVLEWLTPNILYRVKTEEPLVALSLDDGPHPVFTPQVLELLRKYEASATFFLIGERAERHPELVRRILREGHEIGNHYWKDGATLGDSRERFSKKLEETERAIGLSALRVRDEEEEEKKLTQRAQREEHRGLREEEKTEIEHGEEKAQVSAVSSNGNVNREIATPMTGKAASSRRTPKGIRFFRAPGGVAWPWQLRSARERGYTCVLGYAYPHDPMRPPAWYIRWLTTKNLRPGTIVILHDGIKDAAKSIAALPHILEEGKRRGLKFVAVGELVEASE